MHRGLMAQRVVRDVDVIAHAGLDVDTFLEEAMASISRAVPSVAACVATVDPGTLLLTATRKYGDLKGRDEQDREWGMLEYGEVESSSFRELARQDVPAVAMSELTAREGRPSRRIEGFMVPYFGFTDELRVALRDHGQVWGAASLFRGADSPTFDADDLALMASLSELMSTGVRTGLLTRVASGAVPTPTGPAVIIVDGAGNIQQISTGAEERLLDLVGNETSAEATGVIGALVGAALRFAAGLTDLPPRARVRSRSGQWLVLHAARLSPRSDGGGGEVVVTIDEARPPEIVPIVVAAFDLTVRERDVTQLVLQGVDTKEIAATLHVSSYTVQDHLKSIFEKADVRSRRELIARIYFDQYVPRLNTAIGPDGWFASV
ncbi:LuxR C-terminal-related transcriptional regulator [Raineyella fluvialis]|uniref:LuxR family transcriptional regulator n=1 Tax=Raineyella fluvialis TaxID=2662261 RepID=A0A5Q2FC99_9ACTN|nr:LuxR C-terminal-related transcriptional regulator [Raineyella fluvialis]QGF24690.1 LuxR family transcriptional regulator [Raineyella fluvialis]